MLIRAQCAADCSDDAHRLPTADTHAASDANTARRRHQRRRRHLPRPHTYAGERAQPALTIPEVFPAVAVRSGDHSGPVRSRPMRRISIRASGTHACGRH